MNIFKNDIKDFIFPLIVYENESAYYKSLKLNYLNNSKVFLKNIDNLIESLLNLGVTNILLFGVPKKRDQIGHESYSDNGVIQTTIKSIRSNFNNKLNIISDVCVCQYNNSGHCGIVNSIKKNETNVYTKFDIDNDKTLKLLGKISLSLCDSGTDFIAPSSMTDGQVWYLKNLLKNNEFGRIKIMSYSAKHNSSLYAPFRNNNYLKHDVMDKSTYQCSFYNQKESIREIFLDIAEGSDWVMIKPSLWYMDIIRRISTLIDVPLVVQNVSGEYALIKTLPKNENLSEREFILFFIKSLKRAGANKIISYFFLDLLKYFEEN